MNLFVVASILLGVTNGLGIPDDAPYISRPDLIPSELEVSVNEKDKVDDSYIFLAPWQSGSLPGSAPYIGPHIYDKDGGLVWSGYGATAHWISNFMPIEGQSGEDSQASYFVGDVSQFGTGYGTYRIMNTEYKMTKALGLQTPYLHDFHEFQYGDNDIAVFSTYQSVPYDLAGYKDDLGDGWVFNNVLTEIDAQTDSTNFVWNSVDHIPQSESMVLGQLEDGKGTSNERPFDYLHMNSIVKDSHGNYLISCRHTWSLYYIDGKSGNIIWTINSNPDGQMSNWELDDDATFAFQHHARWVDASSLGESESDDTLYLSLFDNESNGSNPKGHRDHSRGIILKLTISEGKSFTTAPSNSDDKIGKIELYKEYKPSGDADQVATSQGSVQVLSNGNVLVGWGSIAVLTEYTLDGEKVFEAKINDKSFNSYRAFKSKWTGKPFQEPSVVAKGFQQNASCVAYFSWNGATEVSSYDIYGGNSTDTDFDYLGNVERTGFQDLYTVNDLLQYIKVEPKDASGRSLTEYTTTVRRVNKVEG